MRHALDARKKNGGKEEVGHAVTFVTRLLPCHHDSFSVLALTLAMVVGAAL